MDHPPKKTPHSGQNKSSKRKPPSHDENDDKVDVLSSTRPSVASEEKAELIRSVVQVVTEYFSGPLPPPSVMMGYDEVRPGTSEDIVNMAKREQAHAHSMQERELKDARRESIREWISKLAHGILDD